VIIFARTRKDFKGSPDDIEASRRRLADGSQTARGGVGHRAGLQLQCLTYTPGRKQAGISPAREAQRNLLTKEQSSLSVLTALSRRKQGGFWSGSVLSATMGPGDTIVVPEKTVLGSTTLKNVIALAQSVVCGIGCAVVHP